MRRISEQDQPQYRVTAVFETGAFSFDMSKGATLERLSRRLTHLGKHHGEQLTAVQVMKAENRSPIGASAGAHYRRPSPGLSAEGRT